MRKHFDAIALVITALTIAVTFAFVNDEKLGIKTTVDADADAHSDDAYFTDNDLNGSWDTAGATTITLNGDTATILGSGAYVSNGDVTIASSGRYVVSGALEQGSLSVDANANSKVWILLDGVSITNDTDACIVVDQADKVFLTLADGSTNTLTSGETYDEVALADNTDGTIFAHDDLTINGGGKLVVTAGYKHGISANDDLVIAGGDIVVDAPTDGMHANDSLRVCAATLNVTAGDDGLAVDEENGYLYVDSGSIAVTSADEGMVAPGDVTIAGGDVTITTGTEQGHHGIKSGGTCTVSGATILIEECYEGIQALYIDVTGGDVTAYPADDGLNASSGESSGAMGGGPGGDMGGGRGDMGGPGGGMRQMPEARDDEAGQDGDADQDEKAEQDAEAEQNADASQDGDANQEAEGGQGETPTNTDANDRERPQMGERPEGDMPQGDRPQGDRPQGDMSQGDAVESENAANDETTGTNTDTVATEQAESPWIHISGGSVTIVNETGRDADGLDSNGDIVVTGGDVRVSMKGDGSNSAIDYGSESGGVCAISGGTVVACGGSSMAEGFDSSSTQCSVLYGYSSGSEEGTTVTLLDADGNELLSYEVPCSFTSVNLSCPQMVQGETYRIAIGEAEEEVTLDDVATTAGDTSDAQLGMGGRGNPGNPDDQGDAGNQSDAGGRGDQPAGGPEEQPDETDTPESVDDATAAAETDQAESYTTETLVICGIAVAVLVAGLAVAITFRRH